MALTTEIDRLAETASTKDREKAGMVWDEIKEDLIDKFLERLRKEGDHTTCALLANWFADLLEHSFDDSNAADELLAECEREIRDENDLVHGPRWKRLHW